MPGPDNERVWIGGQSGSGKTTYALRLVRRRLEAGGRVVILCDHGEDYSSLGLRRVRITGHDAGRDLSPVVRESSVVELTAYAGDELEELVEGLARAVWSAGRLLFVVDEAHVFWPRGLKVPTLERICTGGRHRSIDWVFVSQHPTMVSIVPLKGANWVVAFRSSERNDADRQAEFVGVGVEELRNLPPLHYVLRDVRKGTVHRGSVQVLDNVLPSAV